MIHGVAYNSREFGQPWMLRGTNQQTNDGLIWLNPAYKQLGANTSHTTARTPGMALGYFALHNRSAAAIVAGIGVRIPNYLWAAGQWTDATTTYTDDTTAAQDTTTGDFPLETTTNNDGHVILSRVPFNAVSYNVTTASVDAGTVTRAVRFSNQAGTGWQTAESNIFLQTGSAANLSTGEAVTAFAAPLDWGKSSSLATGLPNGYYTMNVRSTDAPATTAAIASSIEIFQLYFVTEALADNSVLLEAFPGHEFPMAQDAVEGLYGDALVALFSTTNDQNRLTVQVRPL
jgi:hypothetical protein